MEGETESCVNCSGWINPKTDGLELGMDSMDISTSLIAIYKLHYLRAFMDSPRHSSFSALNTFGPCAGSIKGNLCNDCLSVFINLWKFYEDFNHLRTVSSRLAQEIQTLDNYIKTYEVIRRVKKEPDTETPRDELEVEGDTGGQEHNVYNVSPNDSSETHSFVNDELVKVPLHSDNVLSASSPSSGVKSGPWIVLRRLENDPIAQFFIDQLTRSKNRKRKPKKGHKNATNLGKNRKISKKKIFHTVDTESDLDEDFCPKSKKKPASKRKTKETRKSKKKVTEKKSDIKSREKNPAATKKAPKKSQTKSETSIEIEGSSNNEEVTTTHLDDPSFSPHLKETAESDFDPEDLGGDEKSDSDDEWAAATKPSKRKSTNTPPRGKKRKVDQNHLDYAQKGSSSTKEGVKQSIQEGNDVSDKMKRKEAKKVRRKAYDAVQIAYRKRKIHCASPCWHCEMDFLNPQDCFDHAMSVHFKAGNFICERCARVSELKMTHTFHLRKCETLKPGELLPVHKCEKCDREYPLEYMLKAHMNKHRDSGYYKCSYDGCKFQTKYSSNLNSHIQGVHESLDEPLEKRTCLECNKVFKAEYCYKAHWTKYHSEKGSQKYKEWFKEFLAKKRERRKNKTTEKITICTDCNGLDLLTVMSYITHRKDVHRDARYTTFVCELCGQAFVRSDGFKRHMKSVHADGSKSAVCETCGKVFKSQEYLQFHCKRTHSVKGRLSHNQSVKMSNHRRKIRKSALAQYLKNDVQNSQSQNGANTTVAPVAVPPQLSSQQQSQSLLLPSIWLPNMAASSQESSYYSTASEAEVQNFNDFLKKV